MTGRIRGYIISFPSLIVHPDWEPRGRVRERYVVKKARKNREEDWFGVERPCVEHRHSEHVHVFGEIGVACA